MFSEVRNAAYIDRGSSVAKVLLDHGCTVGDARDLGVMHNELARQQQAGADGTETLTCFTELAGRIRGSGTSAETMTTPYSRVDNRLEITSPARY